MSSLPLLVRPLGVVQSIWLHSIRARQGWTLFSPELLRRSDDFRRFLLHTNMRCNNTIGELYVEDSFRRPSPLFSQIAGINDLKSTMSFPISRCNFPQPQAVHLEALSFESTFEQVSSEFGRFWLLAALLLRVPDHHAVPAPYCAISALATVLKSAYPCRCQRLHAGCRAYAGLVASRPGIPVSSILHGSTGHISDVCPANHKHGPRKRPATTCISLLAVPLSWVQIEKICVECCTSHR